MTTQAFAPGRVEILGNHTDYNGGFVLSAALGLGISCEGKPREDGVIELASNSIEGVVRIPAEDEMLPNATWADYALGVVKYLRAAGVPVGGFSAYYSSTLPMGAGLSSSAAIEVATAMFLLKLTGRRLPALEVARLCRRAENEFVGVNCGLLDQASSVFGRAGHLLNLDCREESIRFVPMPAGASLLIVNSMVRHALTGGEYNERREQCFEAAKALGVPQLRDTNSSAVQAAKMPEIVRQRALHITGENERVMKGIDALTRGDLSAFGALLFESHESSRALFENSTPELDLLVDLCKRAPGVLGARLTGGGFGGAIVALVRDNQATEAAKFLSTKYREESGHEPQTVLCHPGAGAFQVAGWELQ
jgi:galactokinase